MNRYHALHTVTIQHKKEAWSGLYRQQMALYPIRDASAFWRDGPIYVSMFYRTFGRNKTKRKVEKMS